MEPKTVARTGQLRMLVVSCCFFKKKNKPKNPFFYFGERERERERAKSEREWGRGRRRERLPSRFHTQDGPNTGLNPTTLASCLSRNQESEVQSTEPPRPHPTKCSQKNPLPKDHFRLGFHNFLENDVKLQW